MILEVEPAAKAFEAALRKAAHGLSEPARSDSPPADSPPPPDAKPKDASNP
jgi:hypothetical protein